MALLMMHGGLRAAGRILAAFVVAMAVAAGVAPDAFAAAEKAGEIEYLKGAAEIRRAGEAMPARVGMIVNVGDEVRTGEKSRIRIRLVDGSAVQLGANAAIRIARYRKEGGLLDALIDLIRGRARFMVEKLKRSDSRYRVRTDTVLIGVRGTDILAQVEPDAVHVALVDGRVLLSPGAGGEGVLLSRGGYVRVAGAWPVRPMAIPDDWLMDFIRDVGTSREGARRRKAGGDGEDAPTEALRDRSAGKLGAPLVLPR